MKHNLKITFLMVSLFLVAQLIGLFVTDVYLAKGLPYGVERPQLEERTSFLPIFMTILLVTLFAFLLIRLKVKKLLIVWFFFAVVFTLNISFSAFMVQGLATGLAIVLAVIKVFGRNIYIHNFTELFIYGGLSAVFVPILSLVSITILLVLISIYDIIAVWQTKHMIKLAKYQIKELKIFPGLLIPYEKKKQAILGGGDIGFPLLFAGVVLVKFGLLNSLTTVLFTSLALLVLLLLSKRKKFYPAMPFLSIGCFLGFLISLLFF